MRNLKQLGVALLFVENANTLAITKGVVKLSYLLEAIRAAKSVNQSTNPQAEGGASSSQPPTQSQVTMLLD
ncbi:hypothetical protein Q3G72_029510 [Acer saccharum]|nr:hypothetical protein Q3G72_029510 [Acer saccharum]